jgi:hypothetical protein
MMSVLRIFAAACLAAFLLPTAAECQVNSPVKLLGGIGVMLGGPAHTSEQHLAALGFRDTVGRTSTPTTQALPDFFGRVDVRVQDRVFVGFLYSKTRGSVLGEKTVDGGLASSLAAHYDVVTRLIVASYQLNGRVSASVGAGSLRGKIALTTHVGQFTELLHDQAFALALSSEVVVRRHPQFPMVLIIGYNWAARAEGAGAEISTGSGSAPVVWPQSSYPFSHVFVGIGTGFGY